LIRPCPSIFDCPAKMNTLIICGEVKAFDSFAYAYPCMDAEIKMIRRGINKFIRWSNKAK